MHSEKSFAFDTCKIQFAMFLSVMLLIEIKKHDIISWYQKMGKGTNRANDSEVIKTVLFIIRLGGIFWGHT